MKKPLVIILLWMLLGLPGYGISFANLQREWPMVAQQQERQNMGECLGMSLICGPIFTMAIFFATGFAEHGFKWWPNGGK